ncbi:hypothetical protein ID866_4273 [Astraeus odoratus]|nr:hypothetical protein ID866_4273 [Astraeus odoratus]
MAPTEVLKQCPQFRILLIGKSGVGKSCLINRAFGCEEAVERGSSNIDREMVSRGDKRFILHDSQGFEPGENRNLPIVRSFLDKRMAEVNLQGRLHAVWLCYQIPIDSHGQRVMEGAMQEVLEKREVLGKVPAIFVFTKYDILTDFIERNWVDEGKTYTAQDVEVAAEQYLRKHCTGPIERVTGVRNIHYLAVSTKIRYNYLLANLVQLTDRVVSEYILSL